jgi:hypothetical protein
MLVGRALKDMRLCIWRKRGGLWRGCKERAFDYLASPITDWSYKTLNGADVVGAGQPVMGAKNRKVKEG